ncbi:MAG: PTS sugar transporter subunit IIA [Hyphomonadaceae bacterium]|nr:PTS sugar transporter subunit IIA [Hyphomonadaceae bacterium]
MGDLRDLILPKAVLPRLGAVNKRQALQTLAEALATAGGADPRAAFDAVLMRERLAGTGIGEGVAVPHARLPGLVRPIAGFARLDPPIDFDALDGRPADLVCMILAPDDRGGDHLKALAKVSRALRHADMRERLRAARGHDELMAALAAAVPVAAA